MTFCRLWCLAVWPWVYAQCKYQSGVVRIGGPRVDNHWQYLSKFGYMIGEGDYALRLQYVGSQSSLPRERVKLTMDIFLDEDWEEVESLPPCSKARHSRALRHLELKPSGEWGEWQNGTLYQTVRPHVWYFALSACSNQLQNVSQKIRFEARFRQANGSEFSEELRGMFTFHVLYLAAFTACLAKYVCFCRAYAKSSDALHPVIWVLTAAIALQYLGEVLRTDHLWGYSTNGLGSKTLDVTSEILFALSQVVVTSLLIIIGLGYTLLQSKVGDLDLIIPLVMLIAVIHALLVGCGKMADDASYRFHALEGVVGWVILIFRLFLWLWFVWAVKCTGAEGGLRLQFFLRKFLIAGSLYFLGFPVLFMLASVFAPYIQHKVMAGGLLLIQTVTTVWLAKLLLTRGDYWKVSTLSASFLPGGVKVGVVKDA